MVRYTSGPGFNSRRLHFSFLFLPKKFLRWAIREDFPEPHPVPSQLPPRETMEKATDFLIMTWTGGCAIENNLEVYSFSSISR